MNERLSPAALRAGEAAVLRAIQHIDWILEHPAFSDWIKNALRTAMERDPVSVANDVELLRHVLHAWTFARIEYPGGRHG
jgi:hypothetical protein